jgi:hypothetical protein
MKIYISFKKFFLSVSHPKISKTYLMVANFPDEDGFAQVLVKDVTTDYNIDLKIINKFNS